jgi:hypothetical protein
MIGDATGLRFSRVAVVSETVWVGCQVGAENESIMSDEYME